MNPGKARNRRIRVYLLMTGMGGPGGPSAEQLFGCRPPPQGKDRGREGVKKGSPDVDAGVTEPASPKLRAARRALRGARRVHVTAVSGPLDDRAVAALEKAIAGVPKQDVLVVEVDAAGGTAAAALRAKAALLGAKCRTIAFVVGQALGEAAIVPLATEVSALSPRASWGALTPTQFSAARLPDKIRDDLAAAFEATATARGRNKAWARAMVSAPATTKITAGGPPLGKLVKLSATRARTLQLSQGTVPGLSGMLLRFGLNRVEVLREGKTVIKPAQGDRVAKKSTQKDPVKIVAGSKRIIVVDIHGTIELGLRSFVLRVIKEAKKTDLIILDINTFGGRVDAATEIRDALLATPAKTVAFVNPRAISAGALISLACHIIAMRPGSSIGAATPITVSGGKANPVGEKVVSYMRKEMKATAEARGRRGDLAEAMVDAQIEVEDVPDELKETITGLKKGQLLTLTDKEAIVLEMAEVVAKDLKNLRGHLKVAHLKVTRPKVNWAEKISRFLTGPVVSGLLMTLGILGLLLELYTPGFGASGIVGLLCLTLFFFGHRIAGLAGWEPMLLFVVGLALLGVEVFVTPGFGLMGGLGLIAIVGSMVWTLMGPGSVPITVSWNAGYITTALVRTFLGLIAAAAIMAVAVKFLPKVGPFQRLVLQSTIASDATEEADRLPSGVETRKELVGVVGMTETGLRPAGKILVDGRRLDVVSEGEFIEAGEQVRITAVQGRRIVVTKVT